MDSSRNKGDLFRNSTLPEVFDEHSVAFSSSATPAPSRLRMCFIPPAQTGAGLSRVQGTHTDTWLSCPM